MRLLTRIVDSIVLEWQNPRTLRWEAISQWSSVEAVVCAKDFYDKQLYGGW